jgi:putative flippase GtrA
MSTATFSRERVAELVRFALVGGSSTLIYLGVYTAGIVMGLGFALAAVVAFVFSAASGFVLHHRFTFRTDNPTAGGMVRWLALQGTALVINIALLALLVHGAGLNRIVAQIVLLPLIPLLTYVMSRRFVFRPPPQGIAKVPPS